MTESGEKRSSNILIYSKHSTETETIKTGMVDHNLVFGVWKIDAGEVLKVKTKLN